MNLADRLRRLYDLWQLGAAMCLVLVIAGLAALVVVAIPVALVGWLVEQATGLTGSVETWLVLSALLWLPVVVGIVARDFRPKFPPDRAPTSNPYA